MGQCPDFPRFRAGILIVDDDERQRAVLAAMLSDSDAYFETQVAGDGLEALERLTTFNADVMLRIWLCRAWTALKTAPAF